MNAANFMYNVVIITVDEIRLFKSDEMVELNIYGKTVHHDQLISIQNLFSRLVKDLTIQTK